jgi:hypothetical protein
MYVFGYHWDVESDLMGGHTNLESMDCGLLRCLCILVVYFCYGCGGLFGFINVRMWTNVRMWIYVRLSLWRMCCSSTHFTVLPRGCSTCMHDNCLWVVVAAHLFSHFRVLSLGISCIGVAFVVDAWIWGVFV